MRRLTVSAFVVSALALLCAPALAEDAIVVGVYAGEGTSDADRIAIAKALGSDDGLEVRAVTAGELKGLDVLVIGGGSGTTIGKGLGEEGGAAVAAFVEAGGGYVGLGAGAYLGARGYNEGTRVLELVDACLVDRPGWSVRGEGEVELLASDGQPLGALPKTWWFAKGPLFAPARGDGRAPYTPCASFVTDLSKDDEDQEGIMPGTDAIVCARYGKGRAALFSVLPHYTDDASAFLPSAIRWAAGAGTAPKTAAPAPKAGALKVAILDDEGCIGGCILETFVCLDEAPGSFWARRVNGAEVRAGVLDRFDVVMLPGGSATKQTRGLGEAGRKKVRAFVAAGGGYVGVCAGAYVGASEPTRYGLGLAAVRCADTKHWRRGGGQPVDTEATPAFEALTGRKHKAQRIFYMNGPLLEEMEVEGLPAVEPLLTFVSDIHEGNAPAGVMPGKLAALRTQFKKGRVVLFSVHPELTAEFEGTLRRSVLWSAARALD